MKNLLTNYDQKNVKIESMKHVLINKYIDAKFEKKVTEICPKTKTVIYYSPP